jgi:predicted dienelactone hydrolase
MLGKHAVALVLVAGCTAANPNEVRVDSGGAGNPVDLAVAGADLAPVTPAGDLSLPATLHDYGGDGPSTVETARLTARSGLTVDVYLPSATGSHPVVLLASGLQQSGLAYAPYARRLASWGIVTILRDDPGIFQTSADVAADLAFLVQTWLPSQNSDSLSKLFGRVDLSHVGLAGHSRGGQATLLAAETDLKGMVKAWFGLDPVDGRPMGAANAPQARTQLAAIGIPTVFLGETTDSTGNNACAPAADNFQVLYSAAPGPSVLLLAVGADHTQFQDPAQCTFCNLCQKGTADGAMVLAFSVRYLTAFFARELLGDSAVGAAFEGAGAAADLAAGRLQLQTK